MIDGLETWRVALTRLAGILVRGEDQIDAVGRTLRFSMQKEGLDG